MTENNRRASSCRYLIHSIECGMARPSDEPQPTPIPTDYIIYVPLAEYKATAETGQTISYENNIITSSSFTTYRGIPCLDTRWEELYSNTSKRITLEESSINQGANNERSVSIWMVTTSTSRQIYSTLGSFNDGKCMYTPYVYNYYLHMGGDYYPYQTSATVASGEWNHVVQNYYAGGTLEMYLNGELIGTKTGSPINIDNTTFAIGGRWGAYMNSSNGYIAGVRVWNRTLTQDEIQALASEFSPTT